MLEPGGIVGPGGTVGPGGVIGPGGITWPGRLVLAGGMPGWNWPGGTSGLTVPPSGGGGGGTGSGMPGWGFTGGFFGAEGMVTAWPGTTTVGPPAAKFRQAAMPMMMSDG